MVAIPVIAVALFVFYLNNCNPVSIAKLDVGNNRSISIYEECGWTEISAGIYYDVREAGNVIIPMRFIEYYELGYIDFFDFDVAYAEDQSIVGVYDRAGFFRDVIIVDFKTGKAWSSDINSGFNGYKSSYGDWTTRMGKLRNENPDIFPTATPRPTAVLPTRAVVDPTPTSTLVVHPTVYTPEP